MKTSYTNAVAGRFSKLIPKEDCSPEEMMEIFNRDYFRDFPSGISELVCRSGYSGDPSDTAAQADYLYSAMKNEGADISKATVSGWLSGTHYPKYTSINRTHMFQVCFALHLDAETAEHFFDHIYFSRFFNCHNEREAVFYYCIKNGLSYNDALAILKRIDSSSCGENSDIPAPEAAEFTLHIKNSIDMITDTEALIEYITEHKYWFNSWNISSNKVISGLMNDLVHESEDMKYLEDLTAYCAKRNLPYPSDKNCGLLMRHIRKEYATRDGELLEYYKGEKITSAYFMLKIMLGVEESISSETILPRVVTCNFPSKKTFSDFFKNPTANTSYDSIRKMLILLQFWHFWCRTELSGNDDIPNEDLYSAFCDETNDVLYHCGYSTLYVGNPYDFIYMYAARTEFPTEKLREFFGLIEEEKRKMANRSGELYD